MYYSRKDIAEACEKAGLRRGDSVFTHSNVGFFGIPESGANQQEMFSTLLGGFFDVIGEEGTLIAPSYSYGFTKTGLFNPQELSTECGIFSVMMQQHEAAHRSHDPCISVVAIGRQARMLTDGVSSHAYAQGSFFQRFHDAGGIICNMNFDAGSTLVHYYERLLNVPYRYDKTFRGDMMLDGGIRPCETTLYVRDLSSNGTVAAFERFDTIAKESGKAVCVPVGRGSITCISSQDSYGLVKDTLPHEPQFLTEAGRGDKK